MLFQNCKEVNFQILPTFDLSLGQETRYQLILLKTNRNQTRVIRGGCQAPLGVWVKKAYLLSRFEGRVDFKS